MRHDHQAKPQHDAEPQIAPSDRSPPHENWKPIGYLARRLVEKAVSGE